MAKQLIEENMEKIEQICSSSYSYSQKEKEMSENICANFIENYCTKKGGFIELPESKIIKRYSSIKNRMVKEEFVRFAIGSKQIFHINECPTTMDLFDLCFSKGIIKENEYMGQYNIKDLRELIDRSHSKNTQFITGKSLFLDPKYLFNSCINNCNLRNVCIYKKLLTEEEFGKPPKKSEVYENLLDYIPIEKERQTYMHIWTIFNHGYENNKDYSYFDSLGVEPFPSTVKKFDYMQREGLVENYYRVAKICYKGVIDNISDIVNTIYDYEYPVFLKNSIRVIFMENVSPGSLKEVGYTGGYNNSKLIKLKVNEILGI